jgi:hypothetical protein
MDLVEQCLAAEFKFESVLQARFPVLKGIGVEATSLQVNMVLIYSMSQVYWSLFLLHYPQIYCIPMHGSFCRPLEWSTMNYMVWFLTHIYYSKYCMLCVG